MKYLEEIATGDSFNHEEQLYIVTSDYKRNGDRLCVNLKTGFGKWLMPNDIVDVCPVYVLDEDNNIVAVRPTEKDVN